LTPTNLFLIDILSSNLPQFGIDNLKSDTLSRNQEANIAYENDPLVISTVKAHFSKEYLTHVQTISNIIPNMKFPFLATHGSGDKIADPRGSQELYERASSEDKELLLLKDFLHEPFDDPEKEIWEKAVMEWITKRIPKSEGTPIKL